MKRKRARAAGRPAARSGLSELSVASRERAGGGAGRARQGRAGPGGKPRPEQPPPAAGCDARLARHLPAAKGLRSGLVTDYGREEVGTQSPTAAAQATRRRRPHVAPTSALMRSSRPPRRREQKVARAAERIGASGPPAPPSPPPRPPPPKRAEEEKSRRLELCPLLAVSGIAGLTTQQLNRTGGTGAGPWGRG